MYRRNMSDEELRRLERQASSGGPEALDQLNNYRKLHCLPLVPKVLPALAEPYEWSDKVSAWLDDGSTNQPSFIMSFGAYGSTLIVVMNASAEGAIEAAAGWLADNAPGELTQPEYELDEDGNCDECGQNPMNDQCEHISDAEADLTYTESGWLISWEWSMSEVELDRVLVSALSRAIPFPEDSDEDTSPLDPVIVFGSFWEATSYMPNYQRRELYYPSTWSESQVREELDTRSPDPDGKDINWHLTGPDEGIYVCWAEPGDNPLGEDAVDYASAWGTADNPYWARNQNDNYRWISGAQTLLREVNYFKGVE